MRHGWSATPNQQFHDFEKDLNGLLTNFTLSNNEYIITGDFNIDLLKSTSDNKVGRYYHNLESRGCKPLNHWTNKIFIQSVTISSWSYLLQIKEYNTNYWNSYIWCVRSPSNNPIVIYFNT